MILYSDSVRKVPLDAEMNSCAQSPQVRSFLGGRLAAKVRRLRVSEHSQGVRRARQKRQSRYDRMTPRIRTLWGLSSTLVGLSYETTSLYQSSSALATCLAKQTVPSEYHMLWIISPFFRSRAKRLVMTDDFLSACSTSGVMDPKIEPKTKSCSTRWGTISISGHSSSFLSPSLPATENAMLLSMSANVTELSGSRTSSQFNALLGIRSERTVS
mmetsp:Transcript_11021/g.33799  ORF Transcript_11021/g.33799 Transcript_11021/m.33799 type:complete len:214 (-) Transcript_11021:55-696(-)